MGMKAGYRRTEVGVIPEDWDLRHLCSLILSGPRNGWSGRSGKDARGTATLSLSATSSGRLVLNEETVKYLEITLEQGSDVFLRQGDVLVQRSNTSDLVGTTAIFDGPSGVYAYPDLMMRLRFKTPVTAQWFWRYANSSRGRRYFVSVAAGSTGSMPKISGVRLLEMPIPLPVEAEQRAIADALGDADALLNALEKLIAKKRDLKQAAMQRLLTGEARLPCFTGEWEIKALGDIATIKDGTHRTPKYVESGFPFYSVEHVTSGDFGNTKFISESEHRALTRAFRIEKGDILMTRIGSIGDCRLIDWDVDASFYVSLALLKLKPGVSPAFISQYSKSRRFQKQVEVQSLQWAIPKKINLGPISNIEVELPSRCEQDAIAAVLSDMDAELLALERRLAKTRALRQAMMQELLTGRIRLVPAREAHA